MVSHAKKDITAARELAFVATIHICATIQRLIQERSSCSHMIRTATIHDVPRIQEIVNSHAELGKMLFKSYAQLYESLRDLAVYELDGAQPDGGHVVGCTALGIIWADLAEVRSLAVDENYTGRGIG